MPVLSLLLTREDLRDTSIICNSNYSKGTAIYSSQNLSSMSPLAVVIVKASVLGVRATKLQVGCIESLHAAEEAVIANVAVTSALAK